METKQGAFKAHNIIWATQGDLHFMKPDAVMEILVFNYLELLKKNKKQKTKTSIQVLLSSLFYCQLKI